MDVASARDGAQVRANVQQRARPDDARARAEVRVQPGPTARVDAGPISVDLRGDAGAGGGWAVHARRGDVGGGRDQPAVWRVVGPPVPAWPTLLRRAVRDDVHRGVDPRRVRLSRQPAADLPPRRRTDLLDP